jgi:hypothetical protein
VLQAIRRLLTRPECFRLERELPARISTGEISAPWQGTHNNTAERSIRPIPLGRKNALFAGSNSGGERWAVLASLINTAKLHEIDPQTYLADVLDRIVSGRTKANALHELLPWNWKAARVAQASAAT